VPGIAEALAVDLVNVLGAFAVVVRSTPDGIKGLPISSLRLRSASGAIAAREKDADVAEF
jgi:hypothetical protein